MISKYRFLFHLMYLVVCNRLLDYVLSATAPKEKQSCLGARQEGVWGEWRRGFTYFLTRPAQILDAGLPSRWRRRVVLSEYGVCFMPPFWGPELRSMKRLPDLCKVFTPAL